MHGLPSEHLSSFASRRADRAVGPAASPAAAAPRRSFIAPKAAPRASSLSSSRPGRRSTRCRCRCSTAWSSSRSARPTSCPALAESWTVSPDGKVYTFKLRKGVKFHSNANFKPTRDFNADDVLFSLEPDGRRQQSVPQDAPPGQTYAYFDDMGMKNIVDKVEKVDRLHGALHAEAARGAVPRRHGDGLRVDPVDGILRHDDEEGHAERRRRLSDRHRPVRVRRLPEGRDDPLQGVRQALEAAGRRSTTWSIRSPATRPRATPSCKTGECHVMAFPKPADLDEMQKDPAAQRAAEGRPQHRLHRVQRREEAVRQQAGAPGAEHGDQQGGDPRRPSTRATGRSRRIRFRRSCGATTTPSRTTRTTRRRRRSCSRRPAIRTASKSSSGICR